MKIHACMYFLVILSISFSLRLVQFTKGAEYLNNDTAHVLIALTVFPPFNFDCNNFRNFAILNSSFISSRFI